MANPNTLNWLHYQDIQIPDVQLRQEFREFMINGHYQQAINLLNTHKQQLLGKACVAQTLNVIAEGVVILQEKFDTSVTKFLEQLAQEYQDLINNTIKKGVWSSSLQYNPYNFVLYQDEVYVCLKVPPVGTLPTNTNYWKYLGLRGEEGAPGIDVKFQYAWEASVSYLERTVVIYNNNAYVALKPSKGVIPTSDPQTWSLFVEIGAVKIHVGVNTPQKPVNDMIWFQTDSDPAVATTTKPILGHFKRYVRDGDTWEIMYPLTAYSWVKEYNSYKNLAQFGKKTILPNEWQQGKYVFDYSVIGKGDTVQIWPDNMSVEQLDAYNFLTIEVNGSQATLSTRHTPTVELPIIVEVY